MSSEKNGPNGGAGTASSIDCFPRNSAPYNSFSGFGPRPKTLGLVLAPPAPSLPPPPPP